MDGCVRKKVLLLSKGNESGSLAFTPDISQIELDIFNRDGINIL
jgi:hypothetical protein